MILLLFDSTFLDMPKHACLNSDPHATKAPIFLVHAIVAHPTFQVLEVKYMATQTLIEFFYPTLPRDGGKNPLQQRETLPISQVPIRLTNIWYGRLDGIMDPLLSKFGGCSVL